MFSNKILQVQLQPSLDIAAGAYHSFSICTQGIQAWGKSDHCNLPKSNQPKTQEPQLCKIEVTNIAASTSHTFAWKENNVYCWGSNNSYELGLEQQTDYQLQKSQIFEEAIGAGYQLKQITCGQRHTVAVFNIQDQQEERGSHIFCWGQAKNHQLALDTPAIVPYPVLIDFQVPVKQAYSRSDYNIVVDQNGNCYSWGSNIFGRMGFPNQIKTQKIPTLIPLSTKILSVAIGMYHAIAVTENGQAFAWGHGMHGQLGIGKIVSDIEPTKITLEDSVKMASCGEHHSLILLNSGDLLSFGSNAHGALGHDEVDPKKRCKAPTKIQRIPKVQIKKIVSGNRHNLLLSIEGKVYSWGCNKYDQLGKRVEKEQKQENEQRKQRKSNSMQKQKRLLQWKKRYREFKEEESRKEKQFMEQLQQILKC